MITVFVAATESNNGFCNFNWAWVIKGWNVVGDAKLVHCTLIDVLISMHWYGIIADKYQSIRISKYDDAGNWFINLNETRIIEGEFYVLG